MKPNRKRTKRMSVVAVHTMHVFGVIIVLFAMVILNMLASSSCTQLQKEIGRKERALASLERDCERERARWDGMKTLGKLEATLAAHGLNMKYPKPVQIIRMNDRGEPYLAQNSVNEARRRQAAVQAASYKAEIPTAVRTTAPSRVRKARRPRR